MDVGDKVKLKRGITLNGFASQKIYRVTGVVHDEDEDWTCISIEGVMGLWNTDFFKFLPNFILDIILEPNHGRA
jgi:hypothetical protein